jgi:biopolymer transport protein ExbD
MKSKGLQPAVEIRPNVIPLVDIVLCTIVFFLLVAKIGVSTGAEAMDLPESYLGQSLSDMGNTIVVNVRPPKQWIDNPKEVEIGTLFPVITTLVDGEKRTVPVIVVGADGKPVEHAPHPLYEVLVRLARANANFKVIIRGERNLPYQFLQPVLFTCAEAGARNVNFTTKQSIKQLQQVAE